MLHPWDVTPQQAVRIQNELCRMVIKENRFRDIKMVAGVDISIKDRSARAAVMVFSYPELALLEHKLQEKEVSFDYIPGLLSFRESPVIVSAFEMLKNIPQLVIVDGQGIAHPRRLGIASHLGLILDLPTIGCAKTRLCGSHKDPPLRRGCYEPIYDKGEMIGVALCTKDGTNPVYVSIGHMVDLSTAIKFILECSRGYRLPEPIRLAHQLAEGTFHGAQDRISQLRLGF